MSASHLQTPLSSQSPSALSHYWFRLPCKGCKPLSSLGLLPDSFVLMLCAFKVVLHQFMLQDTFKKKIDHVALLLKKKSILLWVMSNSNSLQAQAVSHLT